MPIRKETQMEILKTYAKKMRDGKMTKVDYLGLYSELDNLASKLGPKFRKLEKVNQLNAAGSITPAGSAAAREGRMREKVIADDGSNVAELSELDALKSLLQTKGPGVDLAAVTAKITELEQKISVQQILQKPNFGWPGPSGRKSN